MSIFRSRRKPAIVFVMALLVALLPAVTAYGFNSSRLDLSSERAEATGERRPFEPLYLYYGAKIGLSALTFGTAMTTPDSTALERAIVGGTAATLGVSAVATIYAARAGNSRWTRTWRTVSFVLDTSAAVGLAGYGVYLIAAGDHSDQYSGLAAISVGGLGVLISGLNRTPFRFERGAGTTK
ncbi:MAG: hypothetical protein EA426_17835 [Spirochaetaceae bacterium]|nr:MAG: hypothetical protein EA426_17835 [Spirochaetaceae bacterium]